ncbi:MAG: response regulator [Ardenticatenaceae bacterium]|nr:response regulator [Ardenticatenaceae bacterium]
MLGQPDGHGISNLRQQAESALQGKPVEIATLSSEDVAKLIHELQVHQIELELQNAQLRQTQQELETTRDRYTNLYDFAPVGYLTLNAQGVIQSANLTSVNMLGVSERAALQQVLLTDFVAFEDQDVFFRFWRRLRRSESLQQCEVRLVRKDGTVFYAYVEGVAFEGGDGTAVQCHLILSDINRRRMAEEAVYRTQKLESLGIMAGGIAHDFNNLLSAILVQHELAQVKLPLEHPVQLHLQKASQAARHAVNLTTQLLAYVGQGDYQITLLNLNRVISESVALLEATIPHTISLMLNLSPNLPQLEADASQMQQIAINLIMNAAEAYEDKPGIVWVETRTTVLSEDQINAFSHTYDMSPGEHVVLSVRDEGKGMTSDTMMRVFDPFFTTKFTGRGLGLAAVQGIVRQHRGGIQIDSSWRKGTMFRVYLRPTVLEDVATWEENEAGGGETAVILLIDDEVALRDGIQELLELSGARVLVAGNGPDGLEIFRHHYQDIDVVVLDLTMPMMSGEEVLVELRRIQPDVSVIITTGYGETEALRRLRGMEPFYFFPKPFVVDDLLTKIGEIRGRAQMPGNA